MPSATAGGVVTPAKYLLHDRLLRLSQVLDMVGFGKTYVYAMINSGNFPAPCKPGGTASRWSETEVLTWVAECAAQRSN